MNQRKLQAIGNAGYKKVIKNHTLDGMVNKTLKVYRSVTK